MFDPTSSNRNSFLSMKYFKFDFHFKIFKNWDPSWNISMKYGKINFLPQLWLTMIFTCEALSSVKHK